MNKIVIVFILITTVYACGCNTDDSDTSELLPILFFDTCDTDISDEPIDTGVAISFPTAEGYGRYSVGGRGGGVYYVTTLEDSGEPGSLRYGLEALTGPRNILFKVGGTINLERQGGTTNDIQIRNPYVTIAGQTAPGEGIMISNGGIYIFTHDVTIRHIAVRPGDDPGGSNPEDRDSIAVLTGYNVIIDHVSAYWSIDENMSLWCVGKVPHHVTIQHSISAEGLYDSLHPKGPHSRGLLVGDHVRHVSIHHNLFVHNNRRNPLVKGNTQYIDFFNNVVYNWGGDTGAGSHFSNRENRGPVTGSNILSNYYRVGPDSNTEPLYRESNFYRLSGEDSIYIDGNVIFRDGSLQDAETDSAVYDPVFLSDYLVSAPVQPINNATVNTADASLLTSVLNSAGARIPVLDSDDARIINDVSNETGTIIDSPADVGSGERAGSMSSATDTDGDGIPDPWETSNGLNPHDPEDGPADSGNGYTNLEEYLNDLVGE